MAQPEKSVSVEVQRSFSASLINTALILGVIVFAIALGDSIAFDDREPVSEQVRDVLWFALLCGVAAFATIEILKRVFAVRGIYQRRQTLEWLAERTEQPGLAFRQLVDAMGTGRRVHGRGDPLPSDVARVFSLPTEQLAAQISSAADLALSRPERYEFLLAGIAGVPPPRLTDDVNEDDRREQQFRFAQRVRAGVDQFQISVGERWRRLMQGAALWIAGTYGIALALATSENDRAEARFVFAGLLVGGPLAWVVRDIAAVIERSRR